MIIIIMYLNFEEKTLMEFWVFEKIHEKAQRINFLYIIELKIGSLFEYTHLVWFVIVILIFKNPP